MQPVHKEDSFQSIKSTNFDFTLGNMDLSKWGFYVLAFPSIQYNTWLFGFLIFKSQVASLTFHVLFSTFLPKDTKKDVEGRILWIGHNSNSG